MIVRLFHCYWLVMKCYWDSGDEWIFFFFEGATFQFGTVGDQHVGYQEVAYEVNATQTSHLLQVKGHEDDRSARTTRCFRNGTGYLRSSMNLSIECFHLRSFRNAWGSVHFFKMDFQWIFLVFCECCSGIRSIEL